MNNLYYDLHIHSCLSPCADSDMTPNNIVNMAKLIGLDVIALTDHNSCKNCQATMEIGSCLGMLVVPGMELCTLEEIHLICLFPDLKSALAFDEMIYEKIPKIKNRADIFGEQLMMDQDDIVTGQEELLLINGVDIGLETACELVRELGGAVFPAHIDRTSNSIIATMGELPPECNFTSIEISKTGDLMELEKSHPDIINMRKLINSDAHYLADISEKENGINLEVRSIQCLINKLRT